jgi:hypothetical protein
MRVSGRDVRRLLALLVAIGPLLVAQPASAATTDIGAVAEIGSGLLPSAITGGGFAVQISEAAGSYAVPPGYTTITSWRHSAGTTPGTLTFKVYRPTGATHEFVSVASDTRIITTPQSVQRFDVRIPVQRGDRIGLSSDDVELAYETFDAADRIGFFGIDVPQGNTRTTDGEPFPEFKLDVAATLESAPGEEPPPAPAATGYTLPDVLAVPPKLQGLTLAPRAFAAARRGASTRSTRLRGFGTKVSYRADMAADVRFAVQAVRSGRRTRSGKTTRCLAPSSRNRRGARCKRYVALAGSFTDRARAGANSFYFTGRLGGRTLKPGSYRLRATPAAGKAVGRPVNVSFRIIRRR